MFARQRKDDIRVSNPNKTLMHSAQRKTTWKD